MKKLLLIGATHGNEFLGIEVIDKLKSLGYGNEFDVLIGNPYALQKNVRFIEYDLNRAYPGDPKSSYLEKRLAYENLNIAKQYNYIIDIHEASAGTDDFIIIPRNEIGGSFPLQSLNLEKALLWPEPKGPLGEILENCIELEFGSKGRDRKEMINACTETIVHFLKSQKSPDTPTKPKEIFRVYGTVANSEIKGDQRLEDFTLTCVNGELFYPLLVDQYLTEGIKCYKMKRSESVL